MKRWSSAATLIVILGVAAGVQAEPRIPFLEQTVDSLPEWMRNGLVEGLPWWKCFVLLGTLVVGFSARFIMVMLVTRYSLRVLSMRGREGEADHDHVRRTVGTVGTLLLAGFFWSLLPAFRFGTDTVWVVRVFLRLVMAVSGVVVLYQVVDVLFDVLARKASETDTKLDDQLVPLLRKTTRVLIVAVGALFVLQNLNVDISSLLALGTVGTLAVSFAAKDTIANLFGSVSIFTDRPFQVGDWIVVGETEGVVEEVGMRSTRIRTFYDSLVTVPNSIITVTTIDNYGARKNRRARVYLGLTYDTPALKVHAFCEGVRSILVAHPQVWNDKMEVHFNRYGESSLDVLVYFFLAVPTWTDELRARHEVFLDILRLAERLGVSFAFPTRTLFMRSEGNEQQPTDADTTPKPLREAVDAFGPGGGEVLPGRYRLE